MSGQTVYVIDANSLIFQVFHAIPEMTSPQGEPVNAEVWAKFSGRLGSHQTNVFSDAVGIGSPLSSAQHGYALPNRDIFHPQGAARDWEMIFAMFHRQIPAYQA